MQRFDPPKISGGLLAPATILGTPTEAGLNQKNSTSLTLGTQTAFDFHPPSADLTPCLSRRLNPPASAGLNGARKNLSNLLLNFVIHLLWDFLGEPHDRASIDPHTFMAGYSGYPIPDSGDVSALYLV
jgi:hypothetical protein